MNVFWKSFLIGVVFAILLLVLVPFFVEGMSPSVVIAKMTNSPLKTISLIETIGITGLMVVKTFLQNVLPMVCNRKGEVLTRIIK